MCSSVWQLFPYIKYIIVLCMLALLKYKYNGRIPYILLECEIVQENVNMTVNLHHTSRKKTYTTSHYAM